MTADRATLGTRQRRTHARIAAEPYADPQSERRTAPALYVSTDLRPWTADEPGIYARDVEVDDVAYRRLDLAYYAWPRHRVDIAAQACDAGRLSVEAFDAVCVRFSPIYSRALAAFGKGALDLAESATDVSTYVPPRSVRA